MRRLPIAIAAACLVGGIVHAARSEASMDRPTKRSRGRQRDGRIPILGPMVSPKTPCNLLDEPSEDEILSNLERRDNRCWLVKTVERTGVKARFVITRDILDPPRIFPLIGPAELHHRKYACVVESKRGILLCGTIKLTLPNSRETIAIDHDHFHMLGYDPRVEWKPAEKLQRCGLSWGVDAPDGKLNSIDAR